MKLSTVGLEGKERKEVIAELYRLSLVEGKEVECNHNTIDNSRWGKLHLYNLTNNVCEYRLKPEPVKPMEIWAVVDHKGKVIMFSEGSDLLSVNTELSVKKFIEVIEE